MEGQYSVFRELRELAGAAPLTSAQVGCFIAYALSLFLLGATELTKALSTANGGHDSEASGKSPEKQKLAKGSADADQVEGKPRARSFSGEIIGCDLFKCLRLDVPSLLGNRTYIWAVAEFGTLMMWFFVADRTALLPEGTKAYSRDVFFFVYSLLVIYSFSTFTKVWKTPVLLNRFQTEEWKGWMQVLFLLYHYFEAREMYNAIRVFISAYVWMTGFGNFLYYYKSKDFSLGRFAEMMWRLNFLVFFCCILLNNSYMLYYICPMHTLFTVFVYAALAICPQLNENQWTLFGKILVSFAFIYIFWDIKEVFYAVWSPFKWLVGYTDPRRPGDDDMHEWYFRSSLDRYIWVYGMLCGFAHPYLQAWMQSVDSMSVAARYAIRTAVLGAALTVGTLWYNHVFTLDKYAYNAIHPYTSWIPITVWIFLRNLTPTMRTFSLGVFGWLGCITLETYIGQFHNWLSSSIPDGQPIGLLEVIPQYPLMNFMVVTAVYIFTSYRLFQLTVTLKVAAVPGRDNFKLAVNSVVLLVCGCAFWAAGGVVLGMH